MNNYYYLIVNDGKIGPFSAEYIALARYRELITSGVVVVSAYIVLLDKMIRRII